MKPRVHGNGFIQLALTKTIRLHVWPDHTYPLKRQKIPTARHTHRFSYESTVITGELLHQTFRFHKSGDKATHQLWVPTEDERLRPTGDIGYFSLVDQVTLKPGDEYSLNAGKWHEIVPIAKLSATLMEKRSVNSGPVYVACKIGEKPDNEFDRDSDNLEILLWGIIIEALKGERKG